LTVAEELSLPAGWTEATIGDLFRSWGGMTPSKANAAYWGEGIAWASSQDIKSNRLSRTTHSITQTALDETRLTVCPVGSVLVVVRSGILAHTLPVAVTDVPVVINQDLKAFDSGDSVLNRWLAAWLRANERQILAENRRDGTTVQSRLRPAVFAAACSGKLTADWRDDNADERPPDLASAQERRRSESRRFVEPGINPHADFDELPDNWRLAPLGLLLTDLQYGTSKRCAYDEDGMPVLRIPNVSGGVVSTDDLKFAHLDEREAAALELRSGDLLMIRSNGSVGLVGLTVEVSPSAGGMAYAGYLIRLRVDPGIMIPGFLRLALASPFLRREIEIPARSTSGVHNINSREVRSLGVPVPPLAEQHEIVARVNAALAGADRLGDAIEMAASATEGAARSALAKAFRGELQSRNGSLSASGRPRSSVGSRPHTQRR
jgi:type I restriction enzyme S subunit